MADGQIITEVDGRRLKLGNLDKVLYPGTETTKGEVLHYYTQVATALLPVVADRPATRIRWPHGVADLSFFEKNLPPGAPTWLPRVSLPSSGSRGTGDQVTYPVIASLAELLYLVNLASLEFHVPQWRLAEEVPAHPDRLVIDLDPGAPAGLGDCARLALIVRDRLAGIGLDRCVPVTSGSKGMQVYAALDGSQSSEAIRDAARELAQQLTREHPDLVVWKMTKSKRPGKVLLDWSQNTAAKTTIAPYSMRGKERPTVAAPRTWDEIQQGAEKAGTLRQLLFDEVLDRLDNLGDLFSDGILDSR
ncbi:non-homologous end-joining DNA ligase [Flexivirga oryzae]|uniref:Bifunctional non-homologous end joining protein LigD n=1 Tax=Flexivirga oryzae TaxID=1794944 RepID=A0A839N5B8_9MICO|nr:non-homologous end-joining DNA ligase [Flexivirga oryzae]MBB2892940.1 bifunctional non-homologous end joining protein LigD [Flexivirga oryzae]